MKHDVSAYRTRLEQLIRERDATYPEVCSQFERAATQQGVRATLSVRHLNRLAHGERPGQVSSAATRRVMRSLFGESMDQLLGPPIPAASPVGPRDSADADLAEVNTVVRFAPTVVGADTLTLLADQTEAFRRLDRATSGTAIFHAVHGHIRTLDKLLGMSTDTANRKSLAALLSDASSLGAWIALDSGRPQHAWTHHDLARRAALEAGSAPLTVHAAVQQAFVLVEQGRAQDGLDLVRGIRAQYSRQLPSLLAAWMRASEGEIQADLGKRDECLAAFDGAQHLLSNDDLASELPYVQLDGFNLARWRGNALAKLGDESAIDHLMTALAGDYSIRAQASLEIDLATALAASGDFMEADKHRKEAEDLAERAGSHRQLKRVRRLRLEREAR